MRGWICMSDHFEQFWKAYPSAPSRPKVGKKYCLQLWQRRKLDHQADTIMAALDYHKRHVWDMSKPQYIPMVRTWLFQERYDIEIPDAPKPLTEQEILKLSSR